MQPSEPGHLPPIDLVMIDPPPRRPHPAWILLTAIRQLRGLVLPLAVLLIAGGRPGDRWLVGVSAIVVIFSVGERAMSWRQFRYEVTGGELRVRTGLLARQERSIPLERIQAVDVVETPLQRLLGVVGVRIETAAGGSGAADVTIEALSRADAEWLRRRLGVSRGRGPDPSPLDGREKATTGAVPLSDAALIRRLTTRELLIAGLTSGRFAPIAALLSFGFQSIQEVMPDVFWERLPMQAPGWSVRGVIAIMVVVAIFAWLLAIASTLVTFGGFAVQRSGDRLLITHGLLDRRRRSIPLARIQAITIVESPVRRPFGFATVRFESAGFGKDTAESGMLFPLLRRTEIAALLAAATPNFAVPYDAVSFKPPPARAQMRYVLGELWSSLGLVALATASAAVLPWIAWQWGVISLALAPVAILRGALSFHHAGWALDDDRRLIARGGGFTRVTTIVSYRRLQRRWISQNPLQRRADLMSFGAAVASGGQHGRIRLAHLETAAAFALFSPPGHEAPDAPAAAGRGD